MISEVLFLGFLGVLTGGYKLFDIYKQQARCQKFFADIQSLIQSDRYSEARQKIEGEWTKKSFPNIEWRPATRIFLAVCYLHEKQHVEALEQVKLSLNLYNKRNPIAKQKIPAYATAQEILAQCLDASGEDEMRDRERQKAGELYLAAGEVGMANCLFGLVRSDLGDYERASDSFKIALTSPETSILPGTSKKRVLLHLGADLVQVGRYSEARVYLCQSIAGESGTVPVADIYATLAILCDHEGDKESSAQYLEKAGELAPSSGDAQIVRAKVAMNAGRISEARQKVAEARPRLEGMRQYEAFATDAECLRMLGEWEAAERVLTEGSDLIQHVSRRKTRYYRALLIFQRAVLYHEQKRYRAALQSLDEAEGEIIWHPRMVWECRALRALLTTHINDTELNADDYEYLQSQIEGAVSKFDDPEEGIRFHSSALIKMAECWVVLGQPERGRRLLERVLTATKTSAQQTRLRFQIAECYETMGEPSQARAMYLVVASDTTEGRHPILAQERLNKLAER